MMSRENSTKNNLEKNDSFKNNDTGIKAFFKGFTYAFSGISASIKSERNLRVHLVFLVYVFVFSFFYDFGKTEYILLTIICGLVIFSELVNTAIEALSDKISKEYDPYIKLAKDAGAGAVLVLAIAAIICGFILFFDIEKFKLIFLYLLEKPTMLLLLMASLVVAFLFINGRKSWRK